MVLEIEPTNIKALLRRASAAENIGDKSQVIYIFILFQLFIIEDNYLSLNFF